MEYGAASQNLVCQFRMDEIKEVTVFTLGDSTRLSTWSNVPYFFTETLKSKGVGVNRVDLSPPTVIDWIYRRIILRMLRMIYPDTTSEYFRTFAHAIVVRWRIHRADRAFRHSEANIFLTFSFSSAGISEKPSVQFCDWPYEYYLKKFVRRSPDPVEETSIARENRRIESSQLVLSLFPSVAEEMKRRYRNKHIYYLGNVINALLPPGNKDDALQAKRISRKLLFIGAKKYLEAAAHLVDAFTILAKEYPGLELDIVGLSRDDLG